MISWLRKLAWWTRRRQKEQELRDELQFHLDEETRERLEGGLTPAAARRAAHRDLGNATLVLEDTRTVWSWVLFEQLAQDLRYALRMVDGASHAVRSGIRAGRPAVGSRTWPARR